MERGSILLLRVALGLQHFKFQVKRVNVVII